MKTIAEIGESRLSRILAGGKNPSPERFAGLIKSEIRMLMENYVELEGDVEVEILEKDGEFLFEIKATASRMKMLGILP